MIVHNEILSPEQGSCLKTLGQWANQHGFYLAGGTAVALYYGHRRSLDLDWFTSNVLEDSLYFANKLREKAPNFNVLRTSPGGVQGTMENVWHSFLEFRYHLLQPLLDWDEMSIQMASLDDLACMKLAAIAQRGSRKDFYDLYLLASQHRPLREMLPLYCQKFSVSDISPVLYGLAYFDDAEEEADPILLMDLDWRSVKKRIRMWAQEVFQ